MGEAAGPYAKAMTAENVRRSDAYRVCTPEQAIELAQGLGDDGVLFLNPLLSGIDPATSWEMRSTYSSASIASTTPRASTSG